MLYRASASVKVEDIICFHKLDSLKKVRDVRYCMVVCFNNKLWPLFKGITPYICFFERNTRNTFYHLPLRFLSSTTTTTTMTTTTTTTTTISAMCNASPSAFNAVKCEKVCSTLRKKGTEKGGWILTGFYGLFSYSPIPKGLLIDKLMGSWYVIKFNILRARYDC